MVFVCQEKLYIMLKYPKLFYKDYFCGKQVIKLLFLLAIYSLSVQSNAYEYEYEQSCIGDRVKITDYNYERYLVGLSNQNKHVLCRIETLDLLFNNIESLNEIAKESREAELEILNGFVDGFMSIKTTLAVPHENIYFYSSAVVSKINSLLGPVNDEEHRKIFFKLIRASLYFATNDDLQDGGLYFQKANLIHLSMGLDRKYGTKNYHVDRVQAERLIEAFDSKIKELKNSW